MLHYACFSMLNFKLVPLAIEYCGCNKDSDIYYVYILHLFSLETALELTNLPKTAY